MVPVEKQNTYLSEALKTEKLRAFYFLLQSKAISFSNEKNVEIDNIYFELINSITENDHQKFEKYFSILHKRSPSDNSPFIHNDLLIFSLIVGVFKFEKDREWIKSVITKRSKSSITTTFDNIVNENYQSKSNVPEVTIVFLHLLNKNSLSNDILESAYKGMVNNQSLFQGKTDFNSLVAIKAFEIILTLKQIGENGEYDFLKTFESKFKSRIRVISRVIYVLILIVLFYNLVQLANDFAKTNQSFKDLLGNMSSVFGIIGFSLGAGLFAAFKNRVELLMLKIFGYSKPKEK